MDYITVPISFTKDQDDRLKYIKYRTGLAQAELVRRAVDAMFMLPEEELEKLIEKMKSE